MNKATFIKAQNVLQALKKFRKNTQEMQETFCWQEIISLQNRLEKEMADNHSQALDELCFAVDSCLLNLAMAQKKMVEDSINKILTRDEKWQFQNNPSLPSTQPHKD